MVEGDRPESSNIIRIARERDSSRLLVNSRIVEVDFDDDFELSPASFADFIRRLRDDSVRRLVALVQLEVDLLDERLQVFVVVRLHVNRPLMSVAVFLSLGIERSRHISVNNRLYFGDSLKYKIQ